MTSAVAYGIFHKIIGSNVNLTSECRMASAPASEAHPSLALDFTARLTPGFAHKELHKVGVPGVEGMSAMCKAKPSLVFYYSGWFLQSHFAERHANSTHLPPAAMEALLVCLLGQSSRPR